MKKPIQQFLIFTCLIFLLLYVALPDVLMNPIMIKKDSQEEVLKTKKVHFSKMDIRVTYNHFN